MLAWALGLALALGLGGCAASQPPSPSATSLAPATHGRSAEPAKPALSKSFAKPAPSKTAAKTAARPVATGGVKAIVTFLDVGEGDAILLQIGAFTALVDGGDAAAGGRVAADLRSRGVRTIDELVVTHPHADHIGGLLTVVDAFPVKRAIIDEAGTTATYRSLVAELRRQHTPIARDYAGAVLRFGVARAVVLNPSSHLTGDYNADSIVLALDLNGRRVMLTGDVTGSGEVGVTARYRGPPVYLLKVAHHGSGSSTSASFLADVRPRFAVIEVGPNSYGHPSSSTVARLRRGGATVYTTWNNGDITVTIAPGGAVRWSFSRRARALTGGASTGRSSGLAAAATGATSGDPIVYITQTGTKYHRDGCRYLGHSKIAIRLSVAKARGYTPCSVCDPPR